MILFWPELFKALKSSGQVCASDLKSSGQSLLDHSHNPKYRQKKDPRKMPAAAGLVSHYIAELRSSTGQR